MIVGHVRPDDLVLLVGEVLDGPEEDAAILGAGGQVLAVLAEGNVEDGRAVTLEGGDQPGVRERVLSLSGGFLARAQLLFASGCLRFGRGFLKAVKNLNR